MFGWIFNKYSTGDMKMFRAAMRKNLSNLSKEL